MDLSLRNCIGIAIIVVVAIVLIIIYSRKGTSGFQPVPVNVCNDGGEYGVNMGRREGFKDGGEVPRAFYGDLTVRPLYYPRERFTQFDFDTVGSTYEKTKAPISEIANPVTGVGMHTQVRTDVARAERGAALNRLSEYELQPGQAGYMEEVGDRGLSLLASVSKRSPLVGAALKANNPMQNADVDSDFITDGFYDEHVLRETFTSNRAPYKNELTASRTGLGSTRIDARYDPGKPGYTAHTNYEQSSPPASHAGGVITALSTPKWIPPNSNFRWGYVDGFGFDKMPDDGYTHYGKAEALVTGESRF